MYVLDFLGRKKLSLIAFWGALSLFWMSIYITSFSILFVSFFNFFILIHGSLFAILVGVYGTLQSSWFRRWSPDIALISERILFSMLPVVSIPLLMSVVVGMVGIQNAPFYLCGIMCLLVHLFVVRTKSSFKSLLATPIAPLSTNTLTPTTPSKRTIPLYHAYIQEPAEAQLLCFLCMFLPAVLYWSVHHRTIAFFAGIGHTLNVSVLMAIPLLFLISAPDKYLWWADFRYIGNKHRYGTALVCVSVLLSWFEARIIFQRYPYLLAVPSPWSYILVTGVLYCAITLLAMIIYGEWNTTGKLFIITFSTSAAALLSLAIGLPLWFIPLPTAFTYMTTAFLFTHNWNQFIA
ncbi:hypothetical protein AKO1_013697, partial [Acrasis kona]